MKVGYAILPGGTISFDNQTLLNKGFPFPLVIRMLCPNTCRCLCKVSGSTSDYGICNARIADIWCLPGIGFTSWADLTFLTRWVQTMHYWDLFQAHSLSSKTKCHVIAPIHTIKPDRKLCLRKIGVHESLSLQKEACYGGDVLSCFTAFLGCDILWLVRWPLKLAGRLTIDSIRRHPTWQSGWDLDSMDSGTWVFVTGAGSPAFWVLNLHINV